MCDGHICVTCNCLLVESRYMHYWCHSGTSSANWSWNQHPNVHGKLSSYPLRYRGQPVYQAPTLASSSSREAERHATQSHYRPITRLTKVVYPLRDTRSCSSTFWGGTQPTALLAVVILQRTLSGCGGGHHTHTLRSCYLLGCSTIAPGTYREDMTQNARVQRALCACTGRHICSDRERVQ
jgi:hypothetical protein